MKEYLNHVLEFLPERLAEPKWMNRCRIEGLDRVVQARQNGRPVVLAFSHFAAYRMSGFLLRAVGIPAATLINGKTGDRAKVEQLADRLSPFSEFPCIFYLDQLRKVNEFLAAGNVLLIAVDAVAGKHMDVPVGAGWTFQMATGAVRLAVRHEAVLIPCTVLEEGRWRFQVKLGEPVPAEYLAANDDYERAGKHLLEAMLPDFRSQPENCSDHLIGYFRPARAEATQRAVSE